MTAPKGLRSGGRRLWDGITDDHELDDGQLATLEQACRQRDRADSLASAAASGDPSALRHERESALAMTRLLAALRLPDEKTGKRPQSRQVRGVQRPSGVSSLDRARAAKTG